jgi:hypothetical protein
MYSKPSFKYFVILKLKILKINIFYTSENVLN